MTPAIFGIAGAVLSAEERAFFRDADPAGYVLFRRNCIDRAQMRALTDDLRGLAGRDDLLISIDQEGGRVARMQPPEWPAFPAPARFAELYGRAPMTAMQAVRWNAKAIALSLREVGVTVDLLPVLDLLRPGAADIIGDRALGATAMQVASLGRMALQGLEEGGVVGVIKHMPGHGRALVDSHLALPVVDADAAELEEDLAPFRSLAGRATMGMTAHVVFEAWDAARPATLSPTVIGEVIRGRIGFDGLLMTDDIDMKALSGSAGEKASSALAAGVDVVLDCWARMDEMIGIAEACPPMTERARERLDAAMATVAGVEPADDMAGLIAERERLFAAV